MLGLRPRLRARPSLLDLVRRNNIDQISQSPRRLSSLEADDRPKLIPLPASPQISPKREAAVPSPYHIDDRDDENEVAKMAPVCCPVAMVGDYAWFG
jgi:V-type H+-transporting ATPase subunit A